jgi:chemotaxis protein methyltransferase CheR
MEQALLQRFRQLIASHTGLQIREQEREAFGKTLAVRIKALQLAQPEQYYQLLETGAAQGGAGESEWKQLIVLLTNQESYFFRDSGQFTLLRARILPELIKANREHRTLRLWSAGCSTGEEPYSLAMLVDQLLPQRNGWNICILGTDIKEAALEEARRGVYSPWSFRLIEAALQQRYFKEQQADYKLDARIRSMVTFRQGNLFKDQFPNVAEGFYDMDLVVCRNVFIYFEWNAVSVVIDKFADTLRAGGYLMTGHTELNTQNAGKLQARVLPGSVVYQRSADSAAATESVVTKHRVEQLPAPTVGQIITRSPQSSQLASRSTQPTITPPTTRKGVAPDILQSLLEEVNTVFRNRGYAAAAEKLEHLLLGEPQNYAALCLAAQAYANLGRHDEAVQYCRRAIAVDAFAPLPYSVLAHIAEEQGDSEESKNLLKKVIYLAPSFIPAYLDLAALHEKEGDAIRAKKMRATALELLQTLSPDAIVEPYGLEAQEMIRQLEGALFTDTR